MTRTVALVTGVGPGTGSAIVRRFAQGPYEVAMIARSGERLRELARDIPGTHTFAADVTDTHQMGEVLGRITRELGAPEVVIHNAVGGAFGNFQEIDPAVLERNFQINVMALLHLVRRTAPAMIEAGRGAIIVTGNTSALRGKANFAGFAPTKAAQRVLTESIARELGPKGIHVAYIVIDAVIDVEWTRKMRPDAPDDFSSSRATSRRRPGTSRISHARPGPLMSRSGRSASSGRVSSAAVQKSATFPRRRRAARDEGPCAL